MNRFKDGRMDMRVMGLKDEIINGTIIIRIFHPLPILHHPMASRKNGEIVIVYKYPF